jgi:Dolichyl-phosphate-mannose-protein mannosyltransferase
VDEAESSINALTILEHGYPTDSYLGIPIYENTLIQPSPESTEYEFRDLSYSDKHVAVYHGWLPLYAIAGSFALHRVAPDHANGSLQVKHDLNERKRRTRVARLPAVLFGLLFLAVVFIGGRRLYGADAAWAGLLVGSIYPFHIMICREARYYSAEVALTTACAISLWLFVKDCKWRHVYLAAAVFILLFYTHLLSFFAAGFVCMLAAPFIVQRHQAGFRKLITFALLVAAGTLPWVIATGFYQQQGRIPRAWPLLDLPADFWRYPPVQPWSAAVGIAIALLASWLILAKPRVSPRFTVPTTKLYPLLLFLGAWGACGYATFFAFVPAVSFDKGRLNLGYWGPLFLLASVSAAAIARVIAPRRSVLLAPIVLLTIFFVTGHRLAFREGFSRNWNTDVFVLDRLEAMSLDPWTKLYAAPNDHLILSFYSGLPVQDITPVRTSYLDSYEGDIIYVDGGVSVNTGLLTPGRVRAAALQHGITLSPEDAETWSALLRTRDYRERMLQSLAPDLPPDLEPLPPFGSELLAAHHRQIPRVFSNSSLELVTRGFSMNSWTDWRMVLKYRFIGPAEHSGVHANYAARLRGSDAVILTRDESDTAIYLSRWHPPDTHKSIVFHFVR